MLSVAGYTALCIAGTALITVPAVIVWRTGPMVTACCARSEPPARARPFSTTV
jgi:hypothetical protein